MQNFVMLMRLDRYYMIRTFKPPGDIKPCEVLSIPSRSHSVKQSQNQENRKTNRILRRKVEQLSLNHYQMRNFQI